MKEVENMVKIKKANALPTVPLNTLSVGDTFLNGQDVCIIGRRNGHNFVMELTTGKVLEGIDPVRDWKEVVPIDCELTYKIELVPKG
jgi:hypothetical protein